ncbi:hypothetical protein V7146_11450 [Gottfriedia acidiceleris]|uniref:hypothetical protein n=1 Tax=Gottfriedia acidiceleris TaxID=371036 RepID=UPI0030007626
MDWQPIITFGAGASVPIIVSILNARFKFSYDLKLKQEDQYRKEIRSYYTAKLHIQNCFSIIVVFNQQEIYNEGKLLIESFEKLSSIPLDEIPLEIFQHYHDCMGYLDFISSEKGVNNYDLTDKVWVVNKEMYSQAEKALEILLKVYGAYINKIKKKLK